MTVIPKPASTVVLMDRKDRIYLTKRPNTMKFLGGYYVFPGGAVEKEDQKYMKDHISNWEPNMSFNFAHYIAAARELFEEAGVFLGSKEDGSTVLFKEKKEREYRRLLVKGKISFLHILKQERLQFNLECLVYFGYRITPMTSPYRFATRFFFARLPEGQSPKPDCKEIEEAFWMTPDEALSMYENEQMSMALPTVAALQTIINSKQGIPFMMP